MSAQAFADRLLFASLEISCVVGIAWLLSRVAHAAPASWKLWMWRAVSLKMLLSLLAVGFPLLQSSSGAGTGGAAALPLLPAIILAVYISGVVWALAGLVKQVLLARQLVSEASPIKDHELLWLLDSLSKKMGVQAPALLEGDVASPALVRGSGYAILLPRGCRGSLPPDQLRMVLAHELAHFRGRDLVWGWLNALAGVAFFFHPVQWLASREQALTQEAARDREALDNVTASPANYALLLVRLCSGGENQSRIQVAALGASASFATVKRRIELLRAPRRGMAAVVLSALCLTVATGQMLLSITPRPLPEVPTGTEQFSAEPARGAAVFSPLAMPGR